MTPPEHDGEPCPPSEEATHFTDWIVLSHQQKRKENEQLDPRQFTSSLKLDFVVFQRIDKGNVRLFRSIMKESNTQRKLTEKSGLGLHEAVVYGTTQKS